MTQTQPPLPGMADLAPAETPLEVAARLQIEDLRSRGLLDQSHAITVQLVLDLARVVGLSAAKGKAAGAALAARQLQDAVAALPSARADSFEQLSSKLRAVS